MLYGICTVIRYTTGNPYEPNPETERYYVLHFDRPSLGKLTRNAKEAKEMVESCIEILKMILKQVSTEKKTIGIEVRFHQRKPVQKTKLKQFWDLQPKGFLLPVKQEF